MVAETLVFHAAQAPPNPRVQFPKGPPVGGPARSEVVGCASNDSVEFRDKLRVQIVRAAGQFLHLVFEVVLGLGAHTLGPARYHKAQEGVTLAVGSDASLLGAQLESEMIEDMRVLCLSFLSLVFGLSAYIEIIGITHEAITEFVD